MISHKYKCIFVHLPKVGGGTIENSLTGHSWHNVKVNGLKEQHEPATSLMNHYTDKWESYFKFSFVRNPWDLLVSNYLWSKRKYRGGPPNPPLTTETLKHFILNIEEEVKSANFLDKKSKAVWTCEQYSFLINNDNKICMDYIGRLENFEKDFSFVAEKIRFTYKKLPHKNKNKHKHKHYTQYYDDETKQIVAEKYAKDIEYFGYEFGE